MDEISEAYVKHGEGLMRLAASQVGPADAADVVSAAVLGVLSGGTGHVSDLRAYLYTAVANEARSHWRSLDRRRRRDLLLVPETYTAEPPEVVSMINSLGELSAQQRAVIHLTYWEDLPPSAVATRLDVREGTVRRQLARARKKLREALP